MKPKRFNEIPYLHYANCYEEFDVLLATASGGRYLSVCSGFDNTLALLITNPQKIYTFDYNIVQIYFAKLKLVAFKILTYPEVLLFLGLNSNKSQRIKLYEKLKPYLEQEVKTYFDNHLEMIEEGLIFAGKFEYYLQKFHKYILPLVNSKKTINQFMNASTIEEQREIYQKKFNNLFFKLLFKIFFSKKVMAKLGREKSYFAYANIPLSKTLKNRIDLGFNNVLNQDNFFMQYIIEGTFKTLPTYLQEKNFEIIKNNLDKIEFIHGDIYKVFEITKEKQLKFDFFNLSDIFEYMSEEQTLKHEEMIAQMANLQAKVVFWNMIVPRKFQTSLFKELKSYELFLKEKPFFYQKLWRYEKNDC